ncbi:MAG: hypothetical protein IT304_04870 [Dehalococcoidia bacterium]|nr:hypothetical protein [Dehalococcoidia bacterium]
MATVYRTRTLVERITVPADEELGFDSQAAVALARAGGKWEAVSDTVTYDVHDDDPGGCTVTQLAGRAPKEV